MKNKIMDGKKLSEEVFSALKKEILQFKKTPVLSIVLVGDNPESILYTNIKKDKGKEIGIDVKIHNFPKGIDQEILYNKIEQLNKTSNGIIIQLPLPDKFEKEKILNKIDHKKDVDGLTFLNLGKTMFGKEIFAPATPKAIIKLLKDNDVEITGRNVAVVNSSNIVGKPLAIMLVNRGATVTLCHRKTQNLDYHVKKADILITAVGKPGLIKNVKEGAVVIDAGISKKGKKVFGDVDIEKVEDKASYITPVPGGVGPVTVAMLMENVVNACKLDND